MSQVTVSTLVVERGDDPDGTKIQPGDMFTVGHYFLAALSDAFRV
jgi:hypothetical protein